MSVWSAWLSSSCLREALVFDARLDADAVKMIDGWKCAKYRVGRNTSCVAYAYEPLRESRRRCNVDFRLSFPEHSKSLLQFSASEGRSDAKFALSDDRKLMVKSLRKVEMRHFLGVTLKAIVRSHNETRRSLVMKFFGAYKIDSVYLVVFDNLFAGVEPLFVFDLKGCSRNRRSLDNDDKHVASSSSAESSESAQLARCDVVLKDLDFLAVRKRYRCLDADARDRLHAAIKADAALLESVAVIDYSLLIGELDDDGGKEGSGDDDESTIRVEGNRRLRVAIIDVFEPFSGIRRCTLSAVKAVLYTREAVSSVEPAYYARRFVDFACTTVFQ
jgi:Phosphatidylinositol-4-phosphate 5-Kinase